MNRLNIFLNPDPRMSPLSNLHKLFISVNLPFYCPKRELRSIAFLVISLKEDKRPQLISKDNDLTQVTFEKERATKA